uniref:LysM domain-containing protein n=1 Tax=Parastrongyloides trichosuri TaxID=131310 RepID=A0A0N4ZSS5_PARTI
MEYEVKSTDTLAAIAAAHDCTISELIKLNKLPTRMVFSGQIIRVPIPGQQIQITSNQNKGNANMSGKDCQISKTQGGQTLQPRSFSVNETASSDGIRKGPGGVIPVQAAKYANQNPLAKTQSVPVTSKATDNSDELEDDTDCLQRFLKIKVKHVTESDGTVTGTLLVTPNCLMFDPDVSHPLVKENGQDLYGMIANMEDINSVAVYNDIRDLTGENPPENRKSDLFDPDHKKTSVSEDTNITDTINKSLNYEDNEKIDDKALKFTLGNNSDVSDNEDTQSTRDNSNINNSNAQLQIIEEEDNEQKNERYLVPLKEKPRTVSDITNDKSDAFDDCFFNKSNDSSNGSMPIGNLKRQRASSERQSSSSLGSDSSTTFSRFSPNMARRSFGKLGRTLSQRATSLKDSVQSASQTVAASTRNVAHGVVQHTKSAADQLQTGIQTSAKIVATAPSNIVQKGSEFSQEPEKTEREMRREQSLAKLETLAQKTEEARKNITKYPQAQFVCGTTIDEKPELFKSFNSINSQSSTLSGTFESSSPQEPYYMIVRLNRKTVKKNKRGLLNKIYYKELKFYLGIHKKPATQLDYFEDDGTNFGNRRKKEFWFAIPRTKADCIYHFLLQWSPDKYGHDTYAESEDKLKNENGDLKSTLNQRGFLILNSETDDTCTGKF